MSTLQAGEYKCFEDIKAIRSDGSEYWCARELAPMLEYAKWENFSKVIDRAMIACQNSGYDKGNQSERAYKLLQSDFQFAGGDK